MSSEGMEDAGQVTLIFYKLSPKWWTEPALNLAAAAAQMSLFTHVEVAIGSDAGVNGEMQNVCRVFNDTVGVEMAARTGRNPLFSYIQLGCSKGQETKMLRFAHKCVGKPFSGTAMARSVIWPRKTDGTSYFCAELVADVLKTGGLLDPISNPGAATPQSLHELYNNRATTTANPYFLRQASCNRTLTTQSLVHQRLHTQPQLQESQLQPQDNQRPLQPIAPMNAVRQAMLATSSVWSSTQKPTALRVLNEGTFYSPIQRGPTNLGLTLHSLDFRPRVY